MINYIGRNIVSESNFASNPYLDLINSITLFAVLMFVCNILPYSIYIKRWDVIVTTDGWAAMIYHERSKELWNDGKIFAEKMI